MQPKTKIFLPAVISVSNLARLIGVKMRSVQSTMTTLEMTDTRPDALISFDQAELLALEYNLEAVANEEAAFDIYPRPAPPPDVSAKLPYRPPIVTIMGHVDHGKTTLLDTLRKTSVAAGEAGGITQHIGAFSVKSRKPDPTGATVMGGIDTVTFLDTPGHAAFTAMRSRGASVTDIIVLVIAADDGVKPQTEEVLQLWKELSREADEAAEDAGAVKRNPGKSAVQLVIALNKVDKPDADPERVKRELLSRGIELEDVGGEIPCVEVSGRTGDGLDLLEETLATLAELAELRAEREGSAEGYVLESRVEKGRGNLATVLVKRGQLKAGDLLIAGGSWCKVRQIFDGAGKVVKSAFPGDPVLVAGWRELPAAGEEMLGSTNESQVKRAVANRKEAVERKSLLADAENINERRRKEAEEAERAKNAEYQDRVRRRAIRAGEQVDPTTGKPFVTAEQALKAAATQAAEAAADHENPADSADGATQTEDGSDRKELRLVIKADFSGTVEAVVGAIENIGNAEARVKIVSSGVGDPSDSDVSLAQAVEGDIIGFNVQASQSMIKNASRMTPRPVRIHCDTVIYRLMDHVSQQVAALLPPREEMRVTGEATVLQLFQVNVKSRVFKTIAGCRVSNGSVSRNASVRVLRSASQQQSPSGGGKRKHFRQVEEHDDGAPEDSNNKEKRLVVFQGKMETLKHVKRDVDEMRKGTECGVALDGFQDLQVDDVVQCFHTVQVPRTLND